MSLHGKGKCIAIHCPNRQSSGITFHKTQFEFKSENNLLYKSGEKILEESVKGGGLYNLAFLSSFGIKIRCVWRRAVAGGTAV